jgi:peptidoglycan/xylan/chitin deacetylase (PgdA/CDA1 family)
MNIWTLPRNILYTIVRAVPRSSGAVILVYHSVGNNAYPFTVRPDVFERQMKWLRENGFNIVSLNQLATYREAGVIPARTIVVTFDDGYADNYENAFPVLRRYGIPATIFVITGQRHYDPQEPSPDLPMLSESQLREMHGSGLIDIEPHSQTHRKFSQASEDMIEREVSESKSVIEHMLNKKCAHFAYPKGRHSDAAYRAVARTGIRYAYTTDRGRVSVADNPFAIPRSSISSATAFAQFKGIAVSGKLKAPRFMGHLRRFLLGHLWLSF